MGSVVRALGCLFIVWLGTWLTGCASISCSEPVGTQRSRRPLAPAAAPSTAAIPSHDNSAAVALLPPAGAGAAPPPSPATAATALLAPLRPVSPLSADYSLHALDRARRAQQHKRALVEGLFARAGVAFPPAELLLRGYKRERELEVWAASEPGGAMTLVTRYQVCATSGVLGPKRREGDGQVPEGYYKIQYLWPNSAFYLAMKVGYPNLSDKVLGDRRMPGSDIMIHGGCASIGCLAMSDQRIQELWVMASAVQGRAPVQVHLFPTRQAEALDTLPQFGQHRAFWRNLYEGHALFERERRLPRVTVKWDGRYAFSSAPL